MLKKITFLLGLTILLMACEKRVEEVREIKKIPPKPLQDLELEKWKEELQKPVYLLKLSELKNPFLTPKTPESLRKKEGPLPLQLVGIIKNHKIKIALLQDPSHRGYIVREGDKLGESTIREIGINYIVIEEVTEDLFGRKTRITRKIPLQEEKP